MASSGFKLRSSFISVIRYPNAHAIFSNESRHYNQCSVFSRNDAVGKAPPPGPLPVGRGEGEANLRCRALTRGVLAQNAQTHSLSPSDGERARVRGRFVRGRFNWIVAPGR